MSEVVSRKTIARKIVKIVGASAESGREKKSERRNQKEEIRKKKSEKRIEKMKKIG